MFHTSKGVATGRETQHKRGNFRLVTKPDGRDFEQLYRESYSTVYNFIRVRMKNDADAEDIVSEAYIKAARAFATFDPTRAKFATWVITIAKNCMISYYRSQRPTVVLDDAPESAFAQDGHEDAVTDLMLVKELLACLDDEEREMVAMKYRDGMRNTDIAATLGINASTVSTKLSRALAKMRSCAERN